MTGGCQCGASRDQVTAAAADLYVCHCRECQRQSGSAFGMSMPVPRAAVRIIGGTSAQWRTEADSGRRVTCFFCPTCGTRLVHAPSRSPQGWNVKPGTLDDTRGLGPSAHIWIARAQGWVSIPPDVPSSPEQPE